MQSLACSRSASSCSPHAARSLNQKTFLLLTEPTTPSHSLKDCQKNSLVQNKSLQRPIRSLVLIQKRYCRPSFVLSWTTNSCRPTVSQSLTQTENLSRTQSQPTTHITRGPKNCNVSLLTSLWQKLPLPVSRRQTQKNSRKCIQHHQALWGHCAFGTSLLRLKKNRAIF